MACRPVISRRGSRLAGLAASTRPRLTPSCVRPSRVSSTGTVRTLGLLLRYGPEAGPAVVVRPGTLPFRLGYCRRPRPCPAGSLFRRRVTGSGAMLAPNLELRFRRCSLQCGSASQHALASLRPTSAAGASTFSWPPARRPTGRPRWPHWVRDRATGLFPVQSRARLARRLLRAVRSAVRLACCRLMP